MKYKRVGTIKGLLKTTTHFEEVLDTNIKAHKGTRTNNVENIIVTTDIGSWNGDETSQNRMCRTIVALGAMPQDTKISWKMADNSVIDVTKENLLEAMLLAGQKQSDLWL